MKSVAISILLVSVLISPLIVSGSWFTTTATESATHIPPLPNEAPLRPIQVGPVGTIPRQTQLQQPIIQQPRVQPTIQQPIVTQPLMPQRPTVSVTPPVKLKESPPVEEQPDDFPEEQPQPQQPTQPEQPQPDFPESPEEQPPAQPDFPEEQPTQPDFPEEEVPEEVKLTQPKPKPTITKPTKEKPVVKPEVVGVPAAVKPVTKPVSKNKLECPPIEFAHDFSCSSGQCLVSFINLTPNAPLDWVDMHLKSNAPTMFAAVGVKQPTVNDFVQVNHRMILTAGEEGMMKMDHINMPMMKEATRTVIPNLGVASLGSSLLKQHHGSQIWQFPVPLSFSEGKELKVSFTYCLNGLDCNTEWFSLKQAQPIMKQALACPAINYKPHLSCATGKCLLSFINLTPNINVDWVDLHLKSNAPTLVKSFGSSTGSIVPNIIPQLNWRMKLAAGPEGDMMKMHSSGSMPMIESFDPLITQLGISPSFGSALKQQLNANQIFQFPLPLSFTSGTVLKASFTYCINGLDCNTEWFDLSQLATSESKLNVPLTKEAPIKQPIVQPIKHEELPLEDEISPADLDMNQPIDQNEPIDQQEPVDLKFGFPVVGQQRVIPQRPWMRNQQKPFKFGLGQQPIIQPVSREHNLVGLSNADLLQQPLQFSSIQHQPLWSNQPQQQQKWWQQQQLLKDQQFQHDQLLKDSTVGVAGSNSVTCEPPTGVGCDVTGAASSNDLLQQPIESFQIMSVSTPSTPPDFCKDIGTCQSKCQSKFGNLPPVGTNLTPTVVKSICEGQCAPMKAICLKFEHEKQQPTQHRSNIYH